jgi:hypothetical protein
VEGIDGPPEVRVSKITKGLQRGLSLFVEQVSIGDDDDVMFREPLCRITKKLQNVAQNDTFSA